MAGSWYGETIDYEKAGLMKHPFVTSILLFLAFVLIQIPAQSKQFESDKELQDYVSARPFLTKLYVNNSPEITKLPKLPDFVVILSIFDCKNLEEISVESKSLKLLAIRKCPSLKNIKNLEESKSLKELDIDGTTMAILPNLPNCLWKLLVADCPSLTHLPNLPITLDSVGLARCPMIKQLPLFPNSLTHLSLIECRGLSHLPELPKRLLGFYVDGCRLVEVPELPPKLIQLTFDIANRELFCQLRIFYASASDGK